MRFERCFAGILFALIIGCSQAHLLPEDIRPFYNSSVDCVQGMRSALAASPDAPVRVLMLHGMITRDPGYSEHLQKKIAQERLQLDRQSEEVTPEPIERGYKVIVFDGPQPLEIDVPQSEVRRTAWRDKTTKRDRLVFYEVRWAEPRDVIKNRFLACFEAGVEATECQPIGKILPNPDRRALLNGFAKKKLMVDGFADATIVLGEIGHVFRDDVRLAMCMVASEIMDPAKRRSGRCRFGEIARKAGLPETYDRLQKAPFFAITHSLGSFLLLDGQIRFMELQATDNRAEQEEMAAFALMDFKTVFMRANQISLLHLSRLKVKCEPEPCPNRLLSSFDPLTAGAGEFPPMTTYVAFNDQNDLLGFELQPYFGERGVVGELVNVSVRNGGWLIPFVLKNPLAAHTASDTNPAIIDAIVEGFDLPKDPSSRSARAPCGGPSPAPTATSHR